MEDIYYCVIYVLLNMGIFQPAMLVYQRVIIKGSLDEKLPIYERDPKSKRIDSFDNRFVRD